MVLIRVAYQILFLCFFLFAAPYYLRKMIKRGKSGRGFGQRFGLFSKRTRRKLQEKSGGLWIHAVSVGEVEIAVQIIKGWQKRHPSVPVILSTTTVTGRATAIRRLSGEVPVFCNPIDFPFSVRTAFDLVRPKWLVLVESEIWPNCLWEAEKRGVPVGLVNARLSHTTEKRYHQCLWFVGPLLRQIACLCVQSERDFKRFLALGVPGENMVMTGSMKYDVSRFFGDAPPVDPEKILGWAGWKQGRPIFLAGSTHRGEEAIVIDIFIRLQKQFPDIFLVLAPRHAERGGEVCALAESLGLHCVRRSKLGGENALAGSVLVLDSTGELRHFYGLARVNFIGKSLVGYGGQNFLEAAQAGRPVVFGPHMENFAVIAEEFAAHGAVVRVADAKGLEDEVKKCFASSTYADELGKKAREVFAAQSGATDRTLDGLEKKMGMLGVL